MTDDDERPVREVERRALILMRAHTPPEAVVAYLSGAASFDDVVLEDVSC